jgi:hypothetical protein
MTNAVEPVMTNVVKMPRRGPSASRLVEHVQLIWSPNGRSRNEKLCLTVLAHQMTAAGLTAPSHKAIARQTGLTRSEVNRAMRKLGAQGSCSGITYDLTPAEAEALAGLIERAFDVWRDLPGAQTPDERAVMMATAAHMGAHLSPQELADCTGLSLDALQRARRT